MASSVPEVTVISAAAAGMPSATRRGRAASISSGIAAADA
jgi:hypothetical protein